jgi:alpha-ketoglutarate-dependent taurine dioxygenase
MAAELEARNLIPAFGAEIVGVDPGTWLDDDTIAVLRDVFDDRGLLLFRDVDVDRPHQFSLTELLRGLEPPTPEEAEAGAAPAQGKFVISNKQPDAAAPIGRLLFHCDGMWSDEPFEVLSLYGVEVEPPVIPTIFASSAYGWGTLSSELRARVDGLHGLHVTGPEYIHERRRRAYDGELSTPKRDHVPLITAPVEHHHPRTDRTLLYVTQGMTREIIELGSDDSEDLLEELFEHLSPVPDREMASGTTRPLPSLRRRAALARSRTSGRSTCATSWRRGSRARGVPRIAVRTLRRPGPPACSR